MTRWTSVHRGFTKSNRMHYMEHNVPRVVLLSEGGRSWLTTALGRSSRVVRHVLENAQDLFEGRSGMIQGGGQVDGLCPTRLESGPAGEPSQDLLSGHPCSPTSIGERGSGGCKLLLDQELHVCILQGRVEPSPLGGASIQYESD